MMGLTKGDVYIHPTTVSFLTAKKAMGKYIVAFICFQQFEKY